MKIHRLFPLSVSKRVLCALPLAFSCILSTASLALANNNGTKVYVRPDGSTVRVVHVPAGRQVLPKRPRLVTASAPLPVFRKTALSVAASPVAATAMSEEQRAMGLINAERRKRGERPLAFDSGLTRIARQHSQNMAQQNFFSHVGRDGRDATARAEAVGIRDWRSMGENIAYNYERYPDPVATAVEQWMRSTKHRDNILNGDFTHTGLGIARSADGRLYFTQVFMTR